MNLIKLNPEWILMETNIYIYIYHSPFGLLIVFHSKVITTEKATSLQGL